MNNPFIIILIIILIWYYNVYYNMKNTKNMLYGFWEADENFCKEAGLDLFHIYFDDPSKNSEIGCYLLAQKNGEIIINDPVTCHININCSYLNNWRINNAVPKFCTVYFNDIDYEFFPNYQELRLYILCGKMVLYTGDTITGVFYKNLINTELKFIKDDTKNNNENQDNQDFDEL